MQEMNLFEIAEVVGAGPNNLDATGPGGASH